MIKAEEERLLNATSNYKPHMKISAGKSISASTIPVPKSDIFLPKRALRAFPASKITRWYSDPILELVGEEDDNKLTYKVTKSKTWDTVDSFRRFDVEYMQTVTRHRSLQEIIRPEIDAPLSPILEE